MKNKLISILILGITLKHILGFALMSAGTFMAIDGFKKEKYNPGFTFSINSIELEPKRYKNESQASIGIGSIFVGSYILLGDKYNDKIK